MRRAGAVALTLALAGCAAGARVPPADIVFVDAYGYTADAARTVVQAVAVRGDRIVAAGPEARIRDYIGPSTEVIDLDGRMLMPGLQDAHIHALGIVESPGCDLDNAPVSLAELAVFVADCTRRFPPGADEFLVVRQWNYAQGNRASPGLGTLRAALDAGGGTRPVMLLGSDGHHGAANSAALARASLAGAPRSGLSAQSLAREFAPWRELVGVDAHGEPDGSLNEGARELVYPGAMDATLGMVTDELLPRVAERLARSGITSIQDPAATPGVLASYRALAATGAANARLHAAVMLSPSDYRDPASGAIDVARMTAEVLRLREAYRGVPKLHVDAAKIFVDGVIEGNPLAEPPTLPNAAALRPYLQPLFARDEQGDSLQLRGYVDTAGAACREARANAAALSAPAAAAAFRAEHGFLPVQCLESRGVLEQPEEFVRDYVAALDRAGITVHAHAIGDRAVRVALDAFEKARAVNGASGLPHAIAHTQLVHPEDVKRFGELGLAAVFTFAWAVPGVDYDLTVIPFIDRVPDVAHLYDEGYYLANVYPAASIAAGGGLVVAGSDAPVDTRDPRPFVNIEAAVTRQLEPGRAYNAREALDIHAALAAYTRNAARALGQADSTGTIEAGKKADLVVLDRNPVQLAESGRAGEIDGTQVLLTMFDGRIVHRVSAGSSSVGSASAEH